MFGQYLLISPQVGKEFVLGNYAWNIYESSASSLFSDRWCTTANYRHQCVWLWWWTSNRQEKPPSVFDVSSINTVEVNAILRTRGCHLGKKPSFAIVCGFPFAFLADFKQPAIRCGQGRLKSAAIWGGAGAWQRYRDICERSTEDERHPKIDDPFTKVCSSVGLFSGEIGRRNGSASWINHTWEETVEKNIWSQQHERTAQGTHYLSCRKSRCRHMHQKRS